MKTMNLINLLYLDNNFFKKLRTIFFKNYKKIINIVITILEFIFKYNEKSKNNLNSNRININFNNINIINNIKIVSKNNYKIKKR